MNTKKQFKWFTIFEYEKEQDYLREMHKAGWKFIEVKGIGIYSFEKCTPQDVIYQFDYNQNGLEHKDEYVKMFADCGWEYIQDYVGYSYFRKAIAENGATEEIFCDEESRFQMMQRGMKGRMLPLLILFFAVLLPQFMNNMFHTHNYFIALSVGYVLVLYLVIFGRCFVKYTQYKKYKK